MSKPYAKLSLSEKELALVVTCVNASRQIVFDKGLSAASAAEKAFYAARTDDYDAFKARLDAFYTADTSQDADPNDYLEEE